MKILTITCHDCYNYGASLQAYALQKYLNDNGFDCSIIDYINKDIVPKYEFTKLYPSHRAFKLYSRLGFFGKLLALYLHRKEIKYRKRKKAFIHFKNKFLKTTPIKYKCIDELRKNKPIADLYIVGSDQVWNTDLPNGHDPAFYLDFVEDRNKCISYAASFGLSCIREKWLPFVKSHLNNFRWISVRENTGVKIVSKLGYMATQVMDPVFLLSRNDWEKLCSKKINEHYLLLYYLGPEYPLVKDICKQIALKHNLKIYAICGGNEISFADKNINSAGPIEFIEYIRDASFVVSTSFHATAFSVLFNKQFIVCPIKGQDNLSRMKDFLELFGLEKHFIYSINNFKYIPIDYETKNLILQEHINRSKKLLLAQVYKTFQDDNQR